MEEDKKENCVICGVGQTKSNPTKTIVDWDIYSNGKYNRFSMACTFKMSIWDSVCAHCIRKIFDALDM